MTDRDTFAAAALIGLLAGREGGNRVQQAYGMADAMLRERASHIPDAGKMMETPRKAVRPKITERGWAGHFICCDRCRFRRNTLIEFGNTRCVVSTVGAFFPSPDGPPDTIGHERHYETMAFWAQKENGYWEADVGRQWMFCSPSCIYGVDDTSDQRANDQHDAVVREIAAKLSTTHDAVPEAIAESRLKEPNGNATGEPGGDLKARLGTGDTPVTKTLPKDKRAEVSAAEPVAWAVLAKDIGATAATCSTFMEAERLAARSADWRKEIVPLYTTPQPTLTDAERAAIEHFARLETSPRSPDAAPATTLWCLLERTK